MKLFFFVRCVFLCGVQLLHSMIHSPYLKPTTIQKAPQAKKC